MVGGVLEVVHGSACGVEVVSSNLGHVDHGACRVSLSDGYDGVQDVFDVVDDVGAAVLVRALAESATTVVRASRAGTPTNRANTIGAARAGRIAEASIILFTGLAGQRSASCATVRVLGAGDSNISHAAGAVG